jgi:hypothetical protein
MTTCLWRSWEARSDLEANGIVSRDVRTRVVAFLTAVFAAIDGLAATLPGATDDDLIAVLGPSVLYLPGPGRARTVAALAGVVADRLEAALDGPGAEPGAEGRLHPWLMAVNRALEGKAVAVQFAIVAIFLKQVLCARLAGRACEDPDRLDHAAEVLAASLGEMLQEVGSRAIPPEAYHVM